jgi:TatD DNase family protein
MIDSHAHIYLKEFDDDREQIIRNATSIGVEKILMPNIDQTSIEAMLEVEREYPEVCMSMMGLHPCSVDGNYRQELKQIEKALSQRDFIAIGEMGTDLYWDKTFWKEQQEVFKVQCEWALEKKLPIVIHSRDSIDESIDLIKPYVERGLRGVFHCFTGTVEQAGKIKELGFYLGIGGVVTFKNAGLDKVVRKIGSDKLMLETDSPYLAPTPYRGKRNEPLYVERVVHKLVEVLELTEAEIINLTTDNARTLFGLNEL